MAGDWFTAGYTCRTLNLTCPLPAPGGRGIEEEERLERLEPFERRELFENYFCLVSQIL